MKNSNTQDMIKVILLVIVVVVATLEFIAYLFTIGTLI
jgi:hypothetical protein